MKKTDSRAFLVEKRRELQRSLQEIRGFVKRTGVSGAGMSNGPRIWLVPLLAAGVGLALALSLRRLRR